MALLYRGLPRQNTSLQNEVHYYYLNFFSSVQARIYIGYCPIGGFGQPLPRVRARAAERSAI